MTRTATHGHLTVVHVLIAALLLVGIVSLTPTGGTRAAWSDTLEVDVPAGTTGGITLGATPGSAGQAWVDAPGSVASTWSPTAVSVTSNGVALTGTQLAGSRLDYRLATSGACSTTGSAAYTASPSGSGTSFAVGGAQAESGGRTLCVTLVPSAALTSSHGGRQLGIITTLSATAAAPSSWTSSAAWITTHQMPASATPEVRQLTCRGQSRFLVNLSWTWADTNGRPGPEPASFHVERLDNGSWSTFAANVYTSGRTVLLRREAFPTRRGTYEVRVVATWGGGQRVASSSIEVSADGNQTYGTLTCGR